MKDNAFAQQTMREIIGGKLSAVVFGVFGHLSLDFGGPSLIAHNPVSLKTGERVLRFGEPGFCDALCGQLGHVISDVQISEDELRIVFAARVRLPCRFERQIMLAQRRAPIIQQTSG